MIGVIFQLGSNYVEFRLDGDNLFVRDSSYGGTLVPFAPGTVNLDYDGVLKELPYLKGDSQWKEKACEELKERFKELETDDEKINYIVDEMKKYGYIPRFTQKKGHRPEKWLD